MRDDEREYIKGIIAAGGYYTNTLREPYVPAQAVKAVKPTDPFGNGIERFLTILGKRFRNENM